MNQDREKLLDEAAVAIAIHTMRVVADNLQNCGDAMQWNWAQCNVYDLRRDADELEKSLLKSE